MNDYFTLDEMERIKDVFGDDVEVEAVLSL